MKPGPFTPHLAVALFACAAACTEAGDAASVTGSPATPAASAAQGEAAKAPGQPGTEAATNGEPGREWVVWRAEEGGFRTRWIAEKGEGYETVAESQALVHFRGESLMHVKRDDVQSVVKTCSCELDDDEEPCRQTGTIMTPGLVAIDLDDDTATPLVTASNSEVFGEVYGRSLRIKGGVGDLLFVESSDSGYYCGAHQSIGGAVEAIELGGDKRDLWKTLQPPAEVRKAAASGDAWKHYKECEEPELGEEEFAMKVMEPSSLAIAVVGGKVELTWGLEAFVPYVCSPDYSVYGEGQTGLVEEAAALGLGGPLPRALEAALADFQDARAVGWAEVALAGERREHQLAKFKALGAVEWPPAEYNEQGTQAPPPASPSKQLELGRKLTRAGKYGEAIAAYDAAITAEPAMHRAWAERGFAKLHQGDLDGAEADCSKAYELDDDPRFRASIAYNLGLIDKKRGDLEAAKVHWENSLGMRPNEVVQRALDELNAALAK